MDEKLWFRWIVFSVDGIYLHLLAASSPAHTPQHGWVSDSHLQKLSKKFGNNIFFYFWEFLGVKEHKTVIINWSKKPSNNTKNQSEHTLILHENEWEQQ